MGCGGAPVVIYPKPYSIYLRGTIHPGPIQGPIPAAVPPQTASSGMSMHTASTPRRSVPFGTVPGAGWEYELRHHDLWEARCHSRPAICTSRASRASSRPKYLLPAQCCLDHSGDGSANELAAEFSLIAGFN